MPLLLGLTIVGLLLTLVIVLNRAGANDDVGDPPETTPTASPSATPEPLNP